jgi:hypothetical protein
MNLKLMMFNQNLHLQVLDKREPIKKSVQFEESGIKGFYNLAFGDLTEGLEELNDTIVSNNGNREKVLATIISAIYSYSEKYPFRWIYAVGSTGSRTRLYQMGISKYLNQVKSDFELYGLINGYWQVFEKGVNYEAFLARRKTNQNEKDSKIKEIKL